MLFADQVIAFFSSLHLELPSSLQTQVLNPYRQPEAMDCTRRFYKKYFSDTRQRIFMLGINPGRFGGGITGISFTDPVALREICGIENDLAGKKELSSEFIYKVVEHYGGAEKFYSKIFMSAICPLGFVKNHLNYNYYDDPRLLRAVTPFIRATFKQQVEMGARQDVLIVVGTGKNKAFIEKLNDETRCFKKIVALDHPRFIMQYRRKKLEDYVTQYVAVLSATG